MARRKITKRDKAAIAMVPVSALRLIIPLIYNAPGDEVFTARVAFILLTAELPEHDVLVNFEQSHFCCSFNELQ
jgi:hypothetical protein